MRVIFIEICNDTRVMQNMLTKKLYENIYCKKKLERVHFVFKI